MVININNHYVDLSFNERQYDLSEYYEKNNVWYSTVLIQESKEEVIRFYFLNEEDRVKFILRWM